MIKEVLYIIVIILGIPTGYLLAYLCKEEIGIWKKRLISIAAIAIVLGIIMFFINFQYKISVSVTMWFIAVFCLTIVFKRKRINSSR